MTAGSLFDDLANELSLIDRWQDAASAREHALEVWRRAGDRLREGTRFARLSRTMWRLCRGREALAAAESALATLEPLGPSPELAWAVANLAAQRMMDGESGAATGLARRAQAIAETLGVPEVVSDALNAEGCALAAADQDGTGRLHEALQIAMAEGLEEQAGRAYANLHALCCGRRRFRRSQPVVHRRNRLLRRARHQHLRYMHAGRTDKLPGDDRTVGRVSDAEPAASE